LIISRFDAFYRLFPEFVGRNEWFFNNLDDTNNGVTKYM
jgi:hypothetical protein